MNTKQKDTLNTLKALLNHITLVADNVDYLSYQSVNIPKNISSYDAYKMMTYHQPIWLRLLFSLRDFLGKIVGIESIKGFDKLGDDEPNVGSTAHFFTITEKDKQTLTLVVRDSHLDVCVHIRLVHANDFQNKLYLITSVKNHNVIGKLYMLPVSIMHPYIVRNLFKNLKVR
ncbi:DUF2867 domain-containing protein [Gilliamella sp. wkB112]|uniref:DUF2867 domain-containing protein n=1 Tax=Gilliamella sp. wkB112 TaxID=3120257 RepID=UPI00080E80AC|nr:DUF2867 domain-containing protein [Gilliamella apicola]OCG02289.1 hypothetical protein A9G12_11320 [Gilliamella apicola]